MAEYISVILPTLNPDVSRLNQTLEGLQSQALPLEKWELILVDNNSTSPILANLNWHPNSKIISQPNPGLTYARLKGFLEARGDIVILVDDDNILDEKYLLYTLDIFRNHPTLGAIGGKSLPLFEKFPPVWVNEFRSSLALRNLGDNTIIEKWENKYPEAGPIGAGMAIRKKSLKSYIKKLSKSKSIITDRKGDSLSSGGDNDIVIEILKSGWHVGYFPSLILYHIIPKERLSLKYLARLSNNSNKSWVQLLTSHNINPWANIPAWTVPLRKIKAWFVYKAWLNKINYIKWRGACGTFEGLSENNFTNCN